MSMEHRREAFSMGLYVSITLLAALTVTGDGDGGSDVLAIVWGTTIGLALAHWFAFDLALRLVSSDAHGHELRAELAVELAGALFVACAATAAVLVVPEHLERQAVRIVTAGLIGLAVFAEAQTFGMSRWKAARAGAIALVLAAIVAAVKYALTH